jgi:hypothetical protein
VNIVRNNESGFTVVEGLLTVLVLAVIGFGGYYVYHSQHKSTLVTNTATTTKQVTSTTTSKRVADPYAGWKTYHSIFNSGLSFEYPANWVFTPATQLPRPNNLGGTENDSVLYSVEPTTTPGQDAAIPTNQYMCVSFDEYSGTGWLTSNARLGTLLTSEPFQSGSTRVSLNTYKGDTPMQDYLLLLGTTSNSHGNRYISTENGYFVSVHANFNCGQGGFPEGSNLNADFNSQPETATAKLVMKSIQL